MNRLSEETLSKMPLNRLKNIRRGVLAQIRAKSGYWCCDLKCFWVENESYSQAEKDEDYAYRDLVNKYYDQQINALEALVKMSQADHAAGRSYSARETLERLRARRG